MCEVMKVNENKLTISEIKINRQFLFTFFVIVIMAERDHLKPSDAQDRLGGK